MYLYIHIHIYTYVHFLLVSQLSHCFKIFLQAFSGLLATGGFCFAGGSIGFSSQMKAMLSDED